MLVPVYAFNKNYSTNMKTKITLFLATVLFFVAIFTACKKENNNAKNDDSTEKEVAVQSDDQSRFSGEMDAVANDADISIENSAGFIGRISQGQSLLQDTICDANVAYNLVSDPKTITITYNGGNCWGTRIRTGKVTLRMAQGVKWSDQGAHLTLTFENLKITRVSDNKSITINGTQTYTNVSGGLLINLLTLGTVTHSITSSDMSITFDDGTQRTWSVAKQRVYTFSGANISITVSGSHSEGNITNIAEWGTNRLGHEFTSATVQPVVIRSDCDFRIVSGEIQHTLPHVTADATFGLDSSGNPTSCPGASGHYYFKIVFTGSGGNSVTLIMPY
jgi:archaellum component FlaF (FlaF/FlaG flagellin family)